ncbi:MAG: hypothetical protein AUH83_10635 [Deltaproteobacteria bacterium 13_1_40CM_4_68_19]|nr:MAG: hypothetical protein AUH83_10635 [Deltaproteobacteria bacterium 13_1_40CM_4_68_19]
MKLLPPPWHELQVIAGESEPSACADPATMGKNESCAVGSSMEFHCVELLPPPVPHAAASTSANERPVRKNRIAPPQRLRERDRVGKS